MIDNQKNKMYDINEEYFPKFHKHKRNRLYRNPQQLLFRVIIKSEEKPVLGAFLKMGKGTG